MQYWLEVSFLAHSSKTANYEAQLFDLGAISVSYQPADEQPLYEPPPNDVVLWDKIILSALFSNQWAKSQLLKHCSHCLNIDHTELKLNVLNEQNWATSWQQYFKPLNISDHLWICPNWIKPPDPSAINVKISPGLAFGTGNHPTTHLCLQWLANYFKSDDSVIDYGCGSGILAIAAKLMGAEKVYGIDIDPQAVTATYNNALANDLKPETIPVYISNRQLPFFNCDVVMANLLSNILIDLADTLPHYVHQNGKLVLCGLLQDQVNVIKQHYQNHVEFTRCLKWNGWVLLEAMKK